MITNKPKEPNVHVDPELLAHLKNVFPNIIPSKYTGKIDLGKRMGHQEVIQHIEYLLRLKR